MCVVGGITAIRIVLLQLFEELMSVVGGITKRVVWGVSWYLGWKKGVICGIWGVTVFWHQKELSVVGGITKRVVWGVSWHLVQKKKGVTVFWHQKELWEELKIVGI